MRSHPAGRLQCRGKGTSTLNVVGAIPVASECFCLRSFVWVNLSILFLALLVYLGCLCRMAIIIAIGQFVGLSDVRK